MSVLSRYIAKAYLRMLGLCLGAFMAIYLVVDFLEKIGRFTRDDAHWRHIIFFFLAKIPEIIAQTAPLAVLMATLLTLGMLSMSSELTAMRSCGISLPRIASPILAIALGVSLLSLLIGELIVPASTAKRIYIQDVLIAKKSPNTFFRQQDIWFKDEMTILNAHFFDPATRTLKGITLWQTNKDLQPLQRVDAREGRLVNGHWLLTGAVIRDIADGTVVSTVTTPSLTTKLGLKVADLKVVAKYTDDMTIKELQKYCEKLKRGGYDPTRYVAQMHGRISLPFSAVIMAFLGIPFALRGGRSSGIALGIGLSLAIGFLYIIMNSVILSFGQAGVLPPFVAAWATNFIFLMGGIWLALTMEN